MAQKQLKPAEVNLPRIIPEPEKAQVAPILKQESPNPGDLLAVQIKSEPASATGKKIQIEILEKTIVPHLKFMLESLCDPKGDRDSLRAIGLLEDKLKCIKTLYAELDYYINVLAKLKESE